MNLGRGILILAATLEVSGLVATFLGGWMAQKAQERQETEDFQHAVERGQMAIVGRLDKYQQGLLSAAAYLRRQPYVTPEEWAGYVTDLGIERNFPGINGFGRISPVPRDHFPDWVRKEKESNPQLKYRGFPRVEPETSMVIDRIEPLNRNRIALGLDVATEARRREAALKSRRTGLPAITRIITLVQDSTKHPGFLMFVPVYRAGASVGSQAERIREHLLWAYAPFVGRRTLEGIAEATGSSLCFDVYDERELEENRIFDGCRDKNPGDRVAVRRMAMAGRTWVVVWKNLSARSEGRQALLSRALLVLGSLNFLGILVLMWWIQVRAGRALKRAEDASRQKDDFLAVMSHEIRTPLNGILSGIELLEQKETTEETRRLLGIIRGSGHSLQELVSEILDLAKLESGGLELEDRPFDPGDLARSCVDSVRATAGSKGLRLEVAVGESVGWRKGDPLRTRQVVVNLLSNAVKFTSDGEVSVSLSGSEDGIEFTIRDTGIGMDAAALQNLFQPFRQADTSIGRRFGGTGLGLAIVKKIVDRMSGTIQVESVPGRGTSFRISLPLPRVETPTVADTVLLGINLRGRRILAVDDNDVNLEVLKGLLESMGCVVGTANDGAGAVAAASTGTWDAILMDCRMPGMDGLEATRLIRSYGWKMPIVALTANAFQSDREACAKAGMDGFLSKPVGLDALRQALSEVLRDR